LARRYAHLNEDSTTTRVGREREHLRKDTSSFPRALRKQATFHYHYLNQHNDKDHFSKLTFLGFLS
jgi:hypothetical protein